MNCRKCGIKCNINSKQEKKFCDECQCNYLSHYNCISEENLSNSIVNELCLINKSMIKNIDETSKLAKTFGISWLPIGIQPSEVDRFMKYFPINSEIRKSFFSKCEHRFKEVQLQIPFHDKHGSNLIFTNGEKELARCNEFFKMRQEKNCDVGRLDHLDKSDGKACSDCSEMISFGEMCVMLPKVFIKDLLVWHPNCFKCIQCQHTLIDYLFCWDDRDDTGPYCLRHFDDRYFPRCGNCNELIFEDEYASILDTCYHIDHLKCNSCDKVLANTEFLLESVGSQAFKYLKCVSCLNIPDIDSCFICRTPLNESHNSIVMIDDFKIHSECMRCDLCQELLSIYDPASYVKENAKQVFCLNCHSTRKLAHCQKCKQCIDLNDLTNIINGRFIWHQQCLQCSICQLNLREGDKFTVIDIKNKISRVIRPNLENACSICMTCFIDKHQDICTLCSKRIDDEGVKYQSKLFHKSCFKCYNCLSDLDLAKFTTNKDQFYCITCYSDLFCYTCFSCKLPIIGINSNNKIINFETRYWHETCFMCFSCNKPLLDIGFLFGDDRISCTDCVVK